MDGRTLVQTLFSGQQIERPPYIPLLGKVVERFGQLDGPAYETDPQQQAVALAQTAAAVHADAVTVGIDASAETGTEVVRRVRPLLSGRALVGVFQTPDTQSLRTYCESDVDLVILLATDGVEERLLRPLGNLGSFYDVPLVLATPTDNAVALAAAANFDGVIRGACTGKEDMVVGGGLSEELLADGGKPIPPRNERFFWTFPGSVPAAAEPERLAALGADLTGA